MKKAGSGGTRPANIWVNPSLPETGKDKKTFGQIILNEPKHHKSMNFYTRYRPVRKKRGTVLQTLLVMKLIFLLVTIACLHVTAASYAQKITLNEKNEPLDKVFNDIKKQSGYIFFYNNNVLTGTTKVSLTLKDATLQEALDQTLNGQPLEYAIVDKTIVIKKKAVTATAEPQTQAVAAPPFDVIGHITNKQGEPLASATVRRTSDKTGTLTDANGNFTLRNVTADESLLVSFLGYQTQEIKIGGTRTFNIIMEEAINKLDQIVIQAYGTTSERLNTGNIGTVTAKEIENQPVLNAIEALQGKIPGVIVTPTNGYDSSPFRIEIRGRSTINPNLLAEPLFIVDGIPYNFSEGSTTNYNAGPSGLPHGPTINPPAGGLSQFMNINPNDIESITVLKDADATAIYGSRGADGVVIITTKKGKVGKTKLDVSAYKGVREVTQRYNLMNTQEYISMRKEAFKNDGITPTVANAYDLLAWDQSAYTDWQKFSWGQFGSTTDVHAALSGGDNQTTFRISGNYDYTTEILTNSGANQRGTLQANISHKSLDKRLNLTLTASYTNLLLNQTFLPSLALIAPNSPSLFDSNGKLNWTGWALNSSTLQSFSGAKKSYAATENSLNGNLNLSYQIIKGLSFSGNLGYNFSDFQQSQTNPIAIQNPLSNPTGSSYIDDALPTVLSLGPQLDYKRLIYKGMLTVTMGGNYEYDKFKAYGVQGSGYVNDNLLGSIDNAPTQTGNSNTAQYKYAAIFGRVNYNWGDKYLINLSARRDGSSRFGDGKQFGNFGAIGAAWIFTGEDWFKNNMNWLSFGKLRGSYGITGSDNIGDYGYLTRWSNAALASYQNTAIYLPTQHANPDLHWQVNKKLETALDLGFLSDQINIEIAWYRNRIGDQLVQYTLPVLTGFSTVFGNFPAVVQNQGWESTLNAKIIDKKDVGLTFSFAAGANKNILLSYPNIAQSPYAALYTVGEPLNMVRLLHYTGVDPQTGVYTVQDRNKDGTITAFYNNGKNDFYDNDLSIRLDGSFGTDFRYKGLQISLYFNFRNQIKKGLITNYQAGAINLNQPTDVLDHWQKPGDIATYAKYSTQSNSGLTYYSASDAIYSNASYLRLKNISLSYNLPATIIKHLGIRACQIYLRGENIFVITPYNGIDPDSAGLGALPPEKTFVGGLQFSF